MPGSVRFGGILICCLLVLSACTQTRKTPAPVGEMGIGGAGRVNAHKVASGDTLYSIAWRYGVDFRDVAAWNGISPPYRIFAGQSLQISAPAGYKSADRKKAESRPSAARKPTPPARKPAKQTRTKQIRTKQIQARQPAKSTGNITLSGRGAVKWNWPARGVILRTFSTRVTGRKGIDIGGKRGDTIKAAASGKVVYSGSGLVGYGKLIIVKHNDKYLSAYGHNDVLLVKEGQFVKAAQGIAKMGLSGKRAQLHFEIRKDGKPVNPMSYLPKR